MALRALVVEDDPGFADVVSRRLGRGGHEVTIAPNQRDAFHVLDKKAFDVVLLDLCLPTHKDDLDRNMEVGFATLDHIRDRFSRDELPVIVMTAFEETSQTAVRALKAFANDYITKPFDDSLEEKLDEVARHLESARRAPSPGTRTSPDPRHRIVFRRDCVEINGIKFIGQADALIRLIGTRTLMLSPNAATNGTTVKASQIAQALGIKEASVRQCVKRVRKQIVDEHERQKKGPIGEQDIIRNTPWKGYAINFETAYIAGE